MFLFLYQEDLKKRNLYGELKTLMQQLCDPEGGRNLLV
jgi:hypothetical protein